MTLLPAPSLQSNPLFFCNSLSLFPPSLPCILAAVEVLVLCGYLGGRLIAIQNSGYDSFFFRFAFAIGLDKAASSVTLLRYSFFPRMQISCCHKSCSFERNSEQNADKGFSQAKIARRMLLCILVSSGSFPTLISYGKTKGKNPYDERRLLEQNKRIQRENNAPEDFPSFIREGFQVKVVTSDNYVRRDSGLIFRDFEVGKGDCPKDGQQVVFHYIGYNESGRRIDSTYLQGSPAKIRMGTNALVPGFEEGIRDMRPGGKRRIIIPPELGPPVGPSTFFSSKQFEVFDVELLSVQDCQRRTIGFYSDVICN